MSVGSGNAAQGYRGSWAKVTGLDGDATATAGAGEANGQQGRAGATGVRQTAQTAAAAIAPATGSPAGVKTLVSTMDDRMADMQRQIDTTKAQNKLLATRLRQMAMAYRSMAGGMPGGGAMGAARGAMGGMGGMPSMGGFGGGSGGGGIPGMSALTGLPAAFAGTRNSRGNRPGDELNTAAPGAGGSAAQQAVAYAKSKIGKPYVWGAVGPNSFDCSGLVMWAYGKAGISLPHHTYEQMAVGAHVSRNNIEPGDRIYCNFSGPGKPEHVMMAISPTMAIEAPTPGQNVHVTSIPLGRIEVRR